MNLEKFQKLYDKGIPVHPDLITEVWNEAIKEERERIKEAVSTIKVETTPPHRPDNTLDWQADLINTHIMPAVRKRFIAEIKALPRADITSNK